MSHKFLSIVRVIEMEIPPANVLLLLETRNLIVWQFPTFIFYAKSEIGVYISIVINTMRKIWEAGGLKKSEIEKSKWTKEKEEVHE